MSERKIICQELKGLKKPLVERNETKTVVSVPKTKNIQSIYENFK